MYNFFADENARHNNSFFITGTDYNHIKNVLRMKIGDVFLVSYENSGHLCRLEKIEEGRITATIIEENYNNTDLPINIYLFQGLPKSDKMEFIIQKAVELGAAGIIPTEMTNCVVSLDAKRKKTKRERWKAISESAAKQSKRNFVPEVFDVLSYQDALKKASDFDLILLPFESETGMISTKNALKKLRKGMSIGIFIGPEGGFTQKEISLAKQAGAEIVSLGKRILRTETAAITAIGMCMLYAEMNLEGEI